MSTTLIGALDAQNPENVHEVSRAASKYVYSITASGEGSLRFMIASAVSARPGAAAVDVTWRALVDWAEIGAGQSSGGTFEVPGDEGSRAIRVIFARGAGTEAVGYSFSMAPA